MTLMAIRKPTLRAKRKRSEERGALIMKPTQGRLYADILGEIRCKPNPAETGTEIKVVQGQSRFQS